MQKLKPWKQCGKYVMAVHLHLFLTIRSDGERTPGDAHRNSARPKLRLKVLEEILKYHLIVSPEVVFQCSFARFGHLARYLDPDLLDIRRFWRVGGRFGWFVDILDADLDLVYPVAIEDHHVRVLRGSDVAGILVHRRHVEVVLQ
jgi:hypothetical protein